MSWTPEKTKRVDDVIRKAAEAREKDELAEALLQVEEETGYEIGFIYDIFTEAVMDEDLTRDEVEDPEKILPVWEQVITTAYEYDY